ncbi:MAG: PAS domain S-box protein, partial [Betaproteobacteria bacterium]|nr:PAS domain S-box protein [Betaproteobacteria bacterium]
MNLGAKRILVVEDEGIIAMELAQNLRELGFEVIGPANEGERALALAEKDPPDLVLMDIVIKGAMDGIETAERMRSQRDVPVVFLTAFGDDATLQRAKGAAPNGYLIKPYRSDELRPVLEMAMHKHQIELRLRESESRFHAAFHDAATGMALIADDGRMQEVNHELTGMLGFSAAELLDMKFDEIVQPEHAAQARAMLADLESGDLPSVRFETKLCHRTGLEFWVQLNISALRDDRRRPFRYIVQVQDIDARKRAEEDLARHRDRLEELVTERTRELLTAKEEAERASHAKSEFLARMSHELRTPMNAILGFAQVLGLEDVPPKQMTMVREIVQAGEHLLAMINDLLDLARIETGKLQVDSATVVPDSIVLQAVQLVTPLAAERNVSIVNQSGAVGEVLADAARLRQILVSLLSNAIKFNRKGGNVVIETRRHDGNLIRISITDTGVGIAAEEIPLLFRP